MKPELEALLELLDLEQIEVNLFRGVSPTEGWQRVYGGQVIGQALVAASRTVDDINRVAHSLHGYFLRPGDTTIPILYKVDRIRDGRSFTTRRVVAIQKGQAIFSMSASFQVCETGLEHQAAMPSAPDPQTCPSETELMQPHLEDMSEDQRAIASRPKPLEMRFIDDSVEFSTEPQEPFQRVWIRTVDRMPSNIRLNQCLLAYASDMTLIDTSYRPHGISWHNDNFQVASLDHAMWFHKPFTIDGWLLYYQDSPFSGGARGFSRGTFYNQQGELIASCAQEGLIRLYK
ncbi:MAG: acyl-CoA thioesterase II [Pseudomonadales bacterium]|nr:acyl-CoA thioesterase II [Pseudomonadales bacterium]